jgi:hypothetical protein
MEAGRLRALTEQSEVPQRHGHGDRRAWPWWEQERGSISISGTDTAISQEWIGMGEHSKQPPLRAFLEGPAPKKNPTQDGERRGRRAPCELTTFSCSEFRGGQGPSMRTRSIAFPLPFPHSNRIHKENYCKNQECRHKFCNARLIYENWVKETRKQA